MHFEICSLRFTDPKKGKKKKKKKSLEIPKPWSVVLGIESFCYVGN